MMDLARRPTRRQAAVIIKPQVPDRPIETNPRAVGGSTRVRHTDAMPASPFVRRRSPVAMNDRASEPGFSAHRHRPPGTHAAGRVLAATRTRPSIAPRPATGAVSPTPRRRQGSSAGRDRFHGVRYPEPVSEALALSAG